MNYKIIIRFVILILLTVALIILPRSVSNGILFKEESVQYITEGKITLTDDRFAEMYLNGGFGEDDIMYRSNKPNEEGTKQSLNKLFEKLFGNNAELLALMTDAKLLSFEGMDLFTVIDERPVGMRLSSAELSLGNAYVSVAYEEKTSTLIHMSYYSTFYSEADTKKETMLAGEVIDCGEKHYKEHLHLDSDRWYSHLSLDQVKEKGIWYCVAEIGLELIPKNEGEIVREERYNLDT